MEWRVSGPGAVGRTVAAMARHVRLLVHLTPGLADPTRGTVRVCHVDSERNLPVPECRFVLSLECEPGHTFARGQVRAFDNALSAALQSSASLFHLLEDFAGPAGEAAE